MHGKQILTPYFSGIGVKKAPLIASIYYILVALVDVVTTYKYVRIDGVAVEHNPLAYMLHFNPVLMFLVNVVVALLVYFATRVEERIGWFVAGFMTAHLVYILVFSLTA